MKTRLSDLKNCGIDSFMFAGITFPKHAWTLPRGSLAKRLQDRKTSCTGDYYGAPKPIKGAHPGAGFYLDSDFQPFTRWAWCDEVDGVRINHGGWYCDDTCTDTIRGIVAILPHGRFLAGWSMGEHMASSVDGFIYSTIEDAAHAADSMAQSAADREREYRETFDADESTNG